jgi:hypothetical protein
VSDRLCLSIALSCCLGFLAACGGGGSTPPTPTLQSVSVSPSAASVVAGKTQQYSATGTYSDGSTKSLSTVDWTTSDSSIAMINSSGLLTGVKQGSVMVSAKSGTISGSTSATIGAAQLVSIAVSPQNPSVRINKQQQFVATGTYTDGTSQPLTDVTWTSTPTTFAAVDTTGLAVGVAPGVSTIQATSGTLTAMTSLTVFAPSAPPFDFVAGQPFGSGGTTPEGVVLADFNGDGKIDIAVSNSDLNTNTVAVFLNDGTGTFGAPITTSITTPASLGKMVAGDFNEDGKTDLAVSQIGGGDQANRVLLGSGNGTFSVQPEIKNSFGFLDAIVVDINGDGHQDLVLAMNGPVAISLGKGDGTFVDTVFYQVDPSLNPGFFGGVSAADFNGDGKLDVVASGYNGYVVFFPGNGDGTLATAVPMSNGGFNLTAQASADFDGDGKLDLLVGLVNGAIIYSGHGDGSFDLTDFEFVYSENVGQPNSGGMSLIATDMANSGKPDAVTADFTTGVLQIVLNGSLGLIPPTNGIFSFSLGAGLNGVAAADLNGDGIKDVVVINFTTGQVATILSQK